MKKLEQFEEKANIFLEKVIDLLKKLFAHFRTGKKSGPDFKKPAKAIAEFVGQKKNAIKSRIETEVSHFKKLDLKNRASNAVKSFLDKTKKLKKSDVVAFFTTIIAAIAVYWGRAKGWVASLKTATVLWITVISTTFSLASLELYLSGKRAMMKSGRSPASKGQGEGTFEPRPEYYKQTRKFYKIGNFRIPIYINNLKSLQIEFMVHTNTRYAKAFLQEMEHESRDHVLRNLEPLSPKFSLVGEGKTILKSRIKETLNSFLAENNIEGEVVEIYIIDQMTN